MSCDALVDQDELQGDPVSGSSMQCIFLCLRQNQFHRVIAVQVLRAAAVVARPGLAVIALQQKCKNYEKDEK